ncbi:putative Leucine-rich repeat protein kinase family protein [Melia azedarach]|uniref:Leucine-rich repeat protein kinase family protein n=1 Tax=Melia azedarach TaxID=155640 RepID=A0ACC1X1K0_MELAZ|nr:putative Leucine-rich repeat protein kinase family protein [Melia azedarach]
MKHQFWNSKWFLLYLLQGIHLLWLTSGLESAVNEADKLDLLDFKQRITQDPLQIMSSWNDSVHFCNWVGVKCNSSHGRVINLNLELGRLVGSIPPSIGNLTYLTGINLHNNGFHGKVSQKIGCLQQLQDLNKTFNYFSGVITKARKIIKNVNKEHRNLSWFTNDVLATSTSRREESFIDLEKYRLQIRL